MTTAIRVDNISKRYKIGQAQGKFRYGMLRDVITSAAAAPIRLARAIVRRDGNGSATQGANYIWALNDVSFDVEEGRVLGIDGRNGAGKSTLLKVLSRVTEPTRGTVAVRGRVGSLLEVTGVVPSRECRGCASLVPVRFIWSFPERRLNRQFTTWSTELRRPCAPTHASKPSCAGVISQRKPHQLAMAQPGVWSVKSKI